MLHLFYVEAVIISMIQSRNRQMLLKKRKILYHSANASEWRAT